VSVVTSNATPQDDLGELDKLLVAKMIDGLKGRSKKSGFRLNGLAWSSVGA
jgi:hypothetical protein